MLSSAPASSLKITFTQSLARPNKQLLLETTYPTFGDLNYVVPTSFVPAPSNSIVLVAMLALNRLSSKWGDRNETRKYGYRKKLGYIANICGVSTVYPLYNGHPAYCVVSEGIVDLESLDEHSREQLGKIEDELRSRGVFHLDLEPRNVLRTRSGGVAVIDFEEAGLLPVANGV
ncbi:hypothetical protein C8R45DRAFT_924954 [Mycena sanguinolenta]|nr:hypothetical protein C8R45DRAFT_924954 [Mycena sanguinolenta]